MHQLPPALAAMAAYRQFIIYKLVPSSNPGKAAAGKMDKLPCDFRTGRVTLKGGGGAHDPATWTDAATAIAAAVNLGAGHGVGFVFTPADPFWFLDLDSCHDGADWSPLAKALVAALPGAAVEVSASGKGLHIFGTGTPPPHGTKNLGHGLEFYHEGRFVALTGTNAVGDCATDLSALLPSLVAQFFPPSAAPQGSDDWTDGPCAGWNGPVDDEDLLRRAMRSASSRAAFGGGASFADLFNANPDALARAYPNAGGDTPYDASSADMALAQHLAFWTGKDCERIKRLMLRSALKRDKWDRDDYLEHFTIPKAVARQVDVLSDKHPEPLPNAPMQGRADDVPGGAMAPPRPRPVAVTGSTFLTIEQQADLFAGCVYVSDAHRVLVPGGVMLKPDQFKVTFGGYSFPMDSANERTSRDSWEAFTQSQALRAPRADTSTFRPAEAPAAIVSTGGRTATNIYWPIDTPRQVGDPSPFLEHLRRVLPDDRDRAILLSYMAAVVQHKGVKFQWAPLLQGIEGNGKTLFTRCVAFAVGARYSHFPNAREMTAKFNDWRYGKIFIGVEDIYVPESRAEVMESLKPMITSEAIEIEGKGEKKDTREVCDNFMLNSNHRDAVRKHRTDRRLAIMYTAQQADGDLARDGMGGAYFPDLYRWLKHEGGYAIVSELLHTFPIDPQFDPAGACQRAPVTSSTEAAIEASRGGVEQEILEAVAQGLPGFAGGWISSLMLDKLLERLNVARRIPLNKRGELLAALGYVRHPGLPDGRVGGIITPDMGRPRLYLRADSPALTLTDPKAIAAAYTAAQDTTSKPINV